MSVERHSHQRVKGNMPGRKGGRQRVEAERSRNTVCVVLDPHLVQLLYASISTKEALSTEYEYIP